MLNWRIVDIFAQKISNMEYTELLERQIVGRLRIDNPWWTEGEIPSFYKEMSPRLYLDLFYPLVFDISFDGTKACRQDSNVISHYSTTY